MRIEPMSDLSARRPSSRPSAQARASWISLFAVLMMFIGPLISQSMPMDHTQSAMPMDGAMSAMQHEAHGEHHGSATAGGELHVLMEKCGYCSLFFHCPALPQTLGIAGANSQRPQSVFVAQPRQGHATHAVFPGARTRAPPSMV